MLASQIGTVAINFDGERADWERDETRFSLHGLLYDLEQHINGGSLDVERFLRDANKLRELRSKGGSVRAEVYERPENFN